MRYLRAVVLHELETSKYERIIMKNITEIYNIDVLFSKNTVFGFLHGKTVKV